MKRILIAAVAAATLAAAPAQAQDTAPLEFEISDAIAACVTPVTKCVDYYADLIIAKAMPLYEQVGETLKNGPDVGAVCELIWEDGCGTGAVPF